MTSSKGTAVLRRLGGCAVALALLLPTQAMASPQSAPDHRAAAPTTTRMVELGHRPVRTSTAAKVRLVFTGRKGQLVNLARVDAAEQCGGRVLRSGGRTVKPWAKGIWRLPRSATYTAVNKPCRGRDALPVRLQVRRVVQHDAVVPGARTTIGARANVTHLVPVRVASGQRVGAVPGALPGEPSVGSATVIGPDRRTTQVPRDGLVLTSVGRYWFELQPLAWLDTTLTVERSAEVDGATIALPRMGTAATTQEVAFTGAAGQWVYAELLDAAGARPGDTPRDIRVFGPDGVEVEKIVLHCRPEQAGPPCNRTGPWLLPSAGRYTMRLSATDAAKEQPVTLRIRAALVAPTLTVDGPPVTYTATTPGQWVIGRFVDAGPEERAWLSASNASASLGAWTVTMAPRFPWSLNCGERDGLGCDEYWRVQVGPGSPTVETLHWTTPDSYALLTVPAGGQGSVDVRLTRTPPTP